MCEDNRRLFLGKPGGMEHPILHFSWFLGEITRFTPGSPLPAGPAMGNFPVLKKHYPEHQHQHHILFQELLGDYGEQARENVQRGR